MILIIVTSVNRSCFFFISAYIIIEWILYSDQPEQKMPRSWEACTVLHGKKLTPGCFLHGSFRKKQRKNALLYLPHNTAAILQLLFLQNTLLDFADMENHGITLFPKIREKFMVCMCSNSFIATK